MLHTVYRMQEQLRISATSHGSNYLPEYYANHTGGFARHGLSVTADARDPWTGVLDDLADGSADVALGGLWVPAMYSGIARDLVVVGQLNGRFPMIVLTRKPVDGFEWDWLSGKTVLVPGAGGTAMYEFTAGLMREAGVDPCRTRFVRDLSSDMLTELYEGGLGDAIVVDLLAATRLSHNGSGFPSVRLAEAGGPMPNSVYYVRRDRLAELTERLVALLSGVHEAMTALNSGADPSQVLTAEWPDIDPEVLRSAARELAGNGTWSSVRVDPAACDRWTAMLHARGLTPAQVSYADIVDTTAVDLVAGA
jgi:NitT/TauT family transport system substrate-binding protein